MRWERATPVSKLIWHSQVTQVPSFTGKTFSRAFLFRRSSSGPQSWLSGQVVLSPVGQTFGGLPWNLADIHLPQRMDYNEAIPWLFIYLHLQVSVFTYPVQYLKIYKKDWHKKWNRHPCFPFWACCHANVILQSTAQLCLSTAWQGCQHGCRLFLDSSFVP